MFFYLFKLQFLQSIRSSSVKREAVGVFFLTMAGFAIFGFILLLGISLEKTIQQVAGIENAVHFVNSYLFYFFLAEIIYRFFLQKSSAVELQKYLHLPIGRNKIIHFLLARSFLSPINILVILLFGPLAFSAISAEFGLGGAVGWLFTLIAISWSLHWITLWFKQKYGDQLVGILVISALMLVGIGASYQNIYNPGELLYPFFAYSLQSYLPLTVAVIVLGLSYYQSFNFYRRNAYLEVLTDKSEREINRTFAFFTRFGLAGEIADQELKLILRHKKSRLFVGFSLIFLLYGLLFYFDSEAVSDNGISFMTIFVGTFITGSFIVNYGQLFLSWNSPYFDFYMSRRNGLQALIKGKCVLFVTISTLCFLLSLPYIFFGWNIFFVHSATFLFNIGINMHIIILISLWEPKPIDLEKGGVFNYEGIGAAQLLLIIPFTLLPYFVFLPFSIWLNEIAGLIALAVVGMGGIMCFKPFMRSQVTKLRNNRYQIASSFRQKL